jgi:hypothetical protein
MARCVAALYLVVGKIGVACAAAKKNVSFSVAFPLAQLADGAQAKVARILFAK